METKLKTICFLFILFFPGKVYSDPGWREYFDYAGVTWNIEEFKTRADGLDSLLNKRVAIGDGVDVHTDTSFDIFLGKKFDRTKGEINYSKNNIRDLRTNYSENQLHYLHTDFAIHELNFNGFYDLFQSKRLNFSIGGGLGIAMVKMTGETYKLSNGVSDAKINDNIIINFCKKNKIFHLFLGHHFDDNLETFLIRKVAGSNFEGLASMPFSIIRNKVQLIRPLINYKKNQIIEFNKKNKIKFIEDPSNFNEKYTRVVIRNFLIQTNHMNIIKKDFKIMAARPVIISNLDKSRMKEYIEI